MNLDDHRKRADYMLDQVLRHGYISVNEVARRLYVSPATIRRDLEVLEQQGLVQRTHGGAVYPSPYSDELDLFYRVREELCVEEKRAIGRAAAALAKPGETIALSSGSTTREVALNLGHLTALTVITNDLQQVLLLSEYPNIEVFVPGGYLRLGRNNLVVSNPDAALGDFRIDMLYLTVTAVTIEQGVSAGHLQNVIYLRNLVARARCCVLVADHTKFQRRPLIQICDWKDIDVVVTDSQLDEATLRTLRKRGLKVVTAVP